MLVNKDLPWHAALIIFVACPQSEYFVVYKKDAKSLSSAAKAKENTCVPVKNLQKSIENIKAQTCVLIAVSMPKLRKPIVVVSCTSLKLLKIRALHKVDEIGGARPGCEEPGAARDRYVTPSRVLARRRPHVRRPAGCGDEDRIEVVLNWGEQLQTFLDTHQTLSRIFL